MEVAPRPSPLAQESGGNTIVGAWLPFAVYISCPGTDESPGTRLWPHQPALTSRSRAESREIGLHIPRSSPDVYLSPAEAGNDRVYALAQPARHAPRAGHIEPIGTRLHPESVAVLDGFSCRSRQDCPATVRGGIEGSVEPRRPAVLRFDAAWGRCRRSTATRGASSEAGERRASRSAANARSGNRLYPDIQSAHACVTGDRFSRRSSRA